MGTPYAFYGENSSSMGSEFRAPRPLILLAESLEPADLDAAHLGIDLAW